jgi:hypothetical protein
MTGHSLARSTYTVPFEVKNLRKWIYGRASELHQLPYKAAYLQATNPRVPIMPILVCRCRQETTRQLGMAIGFYSIQYRTQLIAPAPDVPEDDFEEVRASWATATSAGRQTRPGS